MNDKFSVIWDEKISLLQGKNEFVNASVCVTQIKTISGKAFLVECAITADCGGGDHYFMKDWRKTSLVMSFANTPQNVIREAVAIADQQLAIMDEMFTTALESYEFKKAVHHER